MVYIQLPTDSQVIVYNNSNLTTPTISNTATLLVSQNVRQRTAEKLGVDASSLPQATVITDKSNPTVYTISIRTSNAQETAQLANAWAEAGVEYLTEIFRRPDNELTKARIALEEAERALAEYLQRNGLNQWTWADLQALTGVGFSESGSAGVVTLQPLPSLPDITVAQRLEIARLMQTRLDAAVEYAYLRDQAIRARSALALQPPEILERAAPPESPVAPKMARNTALGAAAGLMLSIAFILLQDWWSQGQEQAKL